MEGFWTFSSALSIVQCNHTCYVFFITIYRDDQLKKPYLTLSIEGAFLPWTSWLKREPWRAKKFQEYKAYLVLKHEKGGWMAPRFLATGGSTPAAIPLQENIIYTTLESHES